jgi:hypothetical protein
LLPFPSLRQEVLPNRYFGALQIAETAEESVGKLLIARIDSEEVLANIPAGFPLRCMPIPAKQARSLGA